VASERNGRWGKAIEVPGSAALNVGGFAQVVSVSCASAGNCAAGGSYTDGTNHGHAFVASERNGRWGRAKEVPGSGVGGFAEVSSVSCPSAGNCAAGGLYLDGAGHGQAFVASERNGRWGKAVEIPGSAALNAGGSAQVSSLSCASAGNCAAAGFYVDGAHRGQVFVVSERNGRWGQAVEIPGSGALNAGGIALVDSLSCASAGNCAAGGSYTDGTSLTQAFVVSERNGRWAKAIEIPGSAALNTGGNASVNSVSCGAAGNCAAGGFYRDGSSHFQAFVASERNGRWGQAVEVPGSGALNADENARVGSVSCSPAGPCAAGGSFQDGSGATQGFVVSRS
jgi:myo-inositol catabolism protein IolC